MKPSTAVALAIACLVTGFFIGFAYTNSRNREFIREQAEKARAEAFSASGRPGGVPAGDSPDDAIHRNPNVETAIAEAASKRGDFDTQTKLGFFLAENGRIPEARECFEAAVKLRPEDWQALAILGRLLAAESKYPEAIARFEAAYKLQPNNGQVVVGLANALFDAKRYEDAQKWYEKALTFMPKDVNVITDLGLTYYFRRPQQLDKAMDYFKQSLSIDPNHTLTIQNYAVALLDANRPEEAKPLVAKLEQLAPQNDMLPAIKQRLAQANVTGNIPPH
ncbi:MAG: tetratricopeptide repeat protein [Chloracidobacterium sp.]|uniref:Tetratricopeptide repeat protein n=1 Tax=Chloracidobacterium validum TaxID=2821543 RepID=A0ABX8B5P2_9BACT|nr:tetratricopeptide repeat protein [Chloracidobacterium validum]QUW01969.1 tetratricopeptide repeat protein [Chloracidobacterium validum]